MPRIKRSDQGEASKALAQAEVHLKEVQARAPEVSEVSRAFKVLRERNHFAERLEALIIGGGGN